MVVLTIAGGVAQIIGFGLTSYELTRTRRREFPHDVPLHRRVVAWAQSKLHRSAPDTHSHELHVTAGSNVTLEREITRPSGTTDAERIGHLELALEDLKSKQREDREAIEERVAETRRRIDEAESGLASRLDRMETERKENLHESLSLQRLGVGLFIVGTVLSVLGSALN
jgi:hypothetical protein